MAERLTEKQTENFYSGKGNDLGDILVKLGKLEDVIEKYGIESVEELDYNLEVFNKMRKVNGELNQENYRNKQDRDTWKKACEKMAFNYDTKLKCENCFLREQCSKEYGGNAEMALSNYFYQQARKESE